MICVTDCRVAYGNEVVLKDVDLEVKSGEIVAIMGSSGGGKTTLLRAIAGLIPMVSGDVQFDGVSIKTEPEEARKELGMVFQSAALFDSLNVRENIKFGLLRLDPRPTMKEINERADEALERVGLEDANQKMPAELSGGMKKRVGLARALALKPKNLLYDEPTTGLDPMATFHIDELILKVRDELQLTSLVVSHDVISVLRFADRISFLSEGMIVFEGTGEEFLSNKHPAIVDMISKSGATKVMTSKQLQAN